MRLLCLLMALVLSEGGFLAGEEACAPDTCSWFGSDAECRCTELGDSALLEHAKRLMFRTAQSLRYLSDQMSEGREALSSSANAQIFKVVEEDLAFLDAAVIHLPKAARIMWTPVLDLHTAAKKPVPAGALAVVVEVWDADVLSSEFVGEAGAPLIQGSMSYTLPLMPNQARGGDATSGLGSVTFDVEASFTTVPCESDASAICVDVQAAVTCRSARGLPDVDSTPFAGTVDPFCVVRIKGLAEDPSASFETDHVDDAEDPSWTSGNAFVHSWRAQAKPTSGGGAARPKSFERLKLVEQIESHLALLRGADAASSDSLGECPAVVNSLLQGVIGAGIRAQTHHPDLVMKFLTGTGLVLDTVEPLSSQWANSFIIATYHLVLTSLRVSDTPTASSLVLPSKTESAPTLSIPPLEVPIVDIDSPMNPLLLSCLHGYLRSLPVEDNLEGSDSDWPAVLALSGRDLSIPEWVQSFWIDYETASGMRIWPDDHVDFRALFWRSGAFEDGLESALAFRWIGTHRVQAVAREYNGESLTWVVKASAFSSLPVRQHFARYGGDMHFNADGLPIMIETPGGRQVDRNDADWQYWKFVWRSSLVSTITVEDHLHVAHFRAANVMATAVRSSLFPDHPMRRLLSVFTFLSIDTNLNAMHVLIAEDHVLHRAVPFEDLDALGRPPSTLPAFDFLHEEIVNESAFRQLPQMLQESPYFQDGSLLMQPIKRLIDEFVATYSSEWCDQSGLLVDHQLRLWARQIASIDSKAGYPQARLSRVEIPTCADMRALLHHFAWTVTGWHRHVGTVGDLFEDPELAATSWKEGERYSRPLQAMTTSIVTASTGVRRPKLSEDFMHMFEGIQKEAEVKAILRGFRAELGEVHDEISRRNQRRAEDWGFAYVQADPDVVECSVAV